MKDGKTSSNVTRRTALAGGVSVGLAAPRVLRAADPLSLGLTPVFLDSDLALLRDLERELSARTGHPISLVKRRTYQEIMGMLLSGQVTAAWICGYPYVKERARLSLLAVPLYLGKPLYRSYLLARSDLPGDNLDAFRGRSHAFSDPDSNSGWLVTRHMLWKLNTTPDAFFGRIFFAYGHRNVVRAVASGLADCGSVDGYVWDVLAQQEPELTAGTRVIHKSDLFGFPPIANLTTASETPAVQALHAALLGLSEYTTGRAILKTLRLDGFAFESPSVFDGIAAMVSDISV